MLFREFDFEIRFLQVFISICQQAQKATKIIPFQFPTLTFCNPTSKSLFVMFYSHCRYLCRRYVRQFNLCARSLSVVNAAQLPKAKLACHHQALSIVRPRNPHFARSVQSCRSPGVAGLSFRYILLQALHHWYHVCSQWRCPIFLNEICSTDVSESWNLVISHYSLI